MKSKQHLTNYLESQIEKWISCYETIGTPCVGEEQLSEIIRIATKCSEEDFDGTLEERRDNFIKEVNEIANQDSYWFQNRYSLGRFIEHFTAHNDRGNNKLMHFEKILQRGETFSLKGRLANWKRQSRKFDAINVISKLSK